MSRSVTSAPTPGASWQQQRRRAVVLTVATDAAVTALLVLLSTALAGGMTTMTGWRPEAVLLISVLVAVPLLARQVWRGRRALAAPEIRSRPAVPAITAAQRAEPASSLQLPGGNLPKEIGVSLIGLARREVRADSAAVLVPDAGTWMVISDADLPDTDGTRRIAAAHQLIREVLYDHSPRIVRGSDRIPGDLAGLPLPASDHVLALPLGRAESVILLSRARPPFHQQELGLLSRVLDAQGTMLDLALKMRKLREDLDGAFE